MGTATQLSSTTQSSLMLLQSQQRHGPSPTVLLLKSHKSSSQMFASPQAVWSVRFHHLGEVVASGSLDHTAVVQIRH